MPYEMQPKLNIKSPGYTISGHVTKMHLYIIYFFCIFSLFYSKKKIT